MPDPFKQLLDATIRHLEDLKQRGEAFVAVSPDTLASLKDFAAHAPIKGLDKPIGTRLAPLPQTSPGPVPDQPRRSQEALLFTSATQTAATSLLTPEAKTAAF